MYATLVDRIVPGFPRKDIAAIKEKLQYDDNLVVQAEIFHLWVIEAPQEIAKEFPADKAGLNVLFVPSEAPYHERKVTLLNGPHTVLSPVAYLSGVNIVRDACQHPVIGQYINKVMFDELMETLNLPKDELKKFAEDVLERFNNPFVDHAVTSIMLNSPSSLTARPTLPSSFRALSCSSTFFIFSLNELSEISPLRSSSTAIVTGKQIGRAHV